MHKAIVIFIKHFFFVRLFCPNVEYIMRSGHIVRPTRNVAHVEFEYLYSCVKSSFLYTFT